MAGMDVATFLRARRARLRPDQVGLPVGDRRRVPGLRREEVAMLAGMSVDYYARLEQGRERYPSPQLIGSLARVLQLDDEARLHLLRLAGLAPSVGPARHPERVDPDLLELMDGWPDHPALVLGHAYDHLAGNRLGRALMAPLTCSQNLLVNLFLDPGARRYYADWPLVAANAVAGFRLAAGASADDARIREVLAALGPSPDFRRLWARNDVRGKSIDVKTFVHPEIGELTLRVQTFDVRSAPGQQLVVYRAEPGSPAATALARLDALAG